MSMRPYPFKYVCPLCRAIHWYRPSNGKCCGCLKIVKLDKVATMPVVEKNSDGNQLRLQIDKFKLDDEWAGQAIQVQVHCSKQADAQEEYDQAKLDEKIERATADKEIRDNPEAYGIGKLTNEVVAQAIELQPAVIAAGKAVIRARHALGKISSDVEALQHRKRALTEMVELYCKDYYSDQGSLSMSDEQKAAIRSRGRRRLERDAEDGRERGMDE